MRRRRSLFGELYRAGRLSGQGRLFEASALVRQMVSRTLAGAAQPAQSTPASPTQGSSRAGGAAADGAQRTPGRFIDGRFSGLQGTRSYKVYVPGVPAAHASLIVMLHGCTQSPDDFARGTRMNVAAEAHGCYVLYPEQTQAANSMRCWNWFNRSDQARNAGEPLMLAGMARAVIEEFGLDRRRVFVAGLSAGGAMAAILAAQYGDVFAAVGIHSGLACGSAHDVGSAMAAMRGTKIEQSSAHAADHAGSGHRGVPAIVFHGDKDKTVHPRNGEHLISELQRELHVTAAAATVEQGKAEPGYPFTRTVYRDAEGRVVLEYWQVHGGGHAWYGGSAEGTYTDPQGPDATHEMMRFFAEHPRPH